MHIDEVASILLKYRVNANQTDFKLKEDLIEKEDFFFFKDKTGWYCRKVIPGEFIGGRITISIYSFKGETIVIVFIDAAFLHPSGGEYYKQFRKYIEDEIRKIFLQLTGVESVLTKKMEEVLVGPVNIVKSGWDK